MPELPFKILGIGHVGIAVNDLNGISDVFGDLFLTSLLSLLTGLSSATHLHCLGQHLVAGDTPIIFKQKQLATFEH